MSRFKYSSLLLFSLATPLCLAPLSSCSTSQSDGVFVLNPSSWSQDGEFEYILNFDQQPTSDVLLEIDDESTGDLILKHNRLAVIDKMVKMELYVPNKPKATTGYYFNVKCFYTNSQGRNVVTKLWDMSSIYEIVEKQDDLIQIQSKVVEKTNSHYFQFMFEFWEQPQCTSVEIEILNDKTNKLSLKKSVVPFSGEESKPYLLMDVILDLSVFLTQAFYFDVSLKFTNSRGEEQVSFFTNLSVSFICDKHDEVPLDYLDLTPINQIGDETLYELHGLKPNVSKVEGGHYSILKIPDNVVIIDEKAFSDPDWFINISKIIVPKTVDKIGYLAFEGCQNLLELDASAYNDDKVPDWIANPQGLFNPSYFPVSSFGYLWIDLLNWTPNESFLNALCLPETWKVCNFSRDVIPYDLYEYNEDKTEITKLKDDEESIEKIKTRSIIKIPDEVQTIDSESFKVLKNIPYERINDDGSKTNVTRRLIVNNKIKSISENLFSYCGISGPICFFNCDIQSIDNGAFENADKYGYWPGLLDVETEPFHIHFKNCPEFNDFGSFAFNLIKCSNTDFAIPDYVLNIGNFAFQGNSFNSIIFEESIETMGRYTFSNIYYRKSPTETKLSKIDLTCYDYIRNPDVRVSDQTCMPAWMNENELFTFLDSCADNGVILIPQKMMDEINAKEEKERKEWIEDFKDNQGIPRAWNFEVKQ